MVSWGVHLTALLAQRFAGVSQPGQRCRWPALFVDVPKRSARGSTSSARGPVTMMSASQLFQLGISNRFISSQEHFMLRQGGKTKLGKRRDPDNLESYRFSMVFLQPIDLSHN